MNQEHFSPQERFIKTLMNLGIRSERVLNVLKEVPRHMFVPADIQAIAYENITLPIGYNQIILQPYVISFMLEAANISPNDTVLEVGIGSGYEAALLSKLCKTVFSVEAISQLGYQAAARLVELGYNNVIVNIDNGFKQHKSNKKFDAIIVTNAPEKIPEILVKQLKLNGRLVVPIGDLPYQKLCRVIKTKTGIIEESFFEGSFAQAANKN